MLNIPNPKRYKAVDNPFGFQYQRNRQCNHPEVFSFDQFDDIHKDNLTKIKQVIKDRIGDCEIYVYGSMIKGCWDENSDYDIKVISSCSTEDMQYLKAYDYGFKVDLSFANNTINYQRKVKI